MNSIKKLCKNILPFSLRHRAQIFLVSHPRYRRYLMQRNKVSDCTSPFYEMLNYLGIDTLEGMTVCELGPGEFVCNAFLEYQLGADREILIDIDDIAGVYTENKAYTIKDISLSNGFLRRKELPLFSHEVVLHGLEKINATYYTNGIESYKKIDDNSVDLLFSHTVLQHIRKKEFHQTIAEISRIIKPGGITYHQVDLRDMMGGRKRHLMIEDNKWEDDVHYSMPCYTNRLQCTQICDAFLREGLSILRCERNYFRTPPVSRSMLSEGFVELQEEEIMTKDFKIVLRKE